MYLKKLITEIKMKENLYKKTDKKGRRDRCINTHKKKKKKQELTDKNKEKKIKKKTSSNQCTRGLKEKKRKS